MKEINNHRNYKNYMRRTVFTVIRDAIRMADERRKSDTKSYFWEEEFCRMNWVLQQLKRRKLGKP